jgi:hypothetical protein
VPSYLVETYLPRGEAGGRTAGDERARLAAAELTRLGRSVRFDHSIHVPSDETCFFVFEAPTASDVAQVATRAWLKTMRIVEAATSEGKTR